MPGSGEIPASCGQIADQLAGAPAPPPDTPAASVLPAELEDASSSFSGSGFVAEAVAEKGEEVAADASALDSLSQQPVLYEGFNYTALQEACGIDPAPEPASAAAGPLPGSTASSVVLLFGLLILATSTFS